MNAYSTIVIFILFLGAVGFYILSYNILEKKLKDAYKSGYEIGYDYGYQKGLKDQNQYNNSDDEMEQMWDDIMETVTMNE